eukprot:358489-Chlamydomonas_euryale.AAC.1
MLCVAGCCVWRGCMRVQQQRLRGNNSDIYSTPANSSGSCLNHNSSSSHPTGTYQQDVPLSIHTQRPTPCLARRCAPHSEPPVACHPARLPHQQYDLHTQAQRDAHGRYVAAVHTPGDHALLQSRGVERAHGVKIGTGPIACPRGHAVLRATGGWRGACTACGKKCRAATSCH